MDKQTKEYIGFTLEEKKQKQIAFFENMLSLLSSRKQTERVVIVWIRAIIYKLNTLKGIELEKCIDALEPIGSINTNI